MCLFDRKGLEIMYLFRVILLTFETLLFHLFYTAKKPFNFAEFEGFVQSEEHRVHVLLPSA